MPNAVDFGRNTEGGIGIVIAGPLAGGDGNDVEKLDNLEYDAVMPEEVPGEVDVM